MFFFSILAAAVVVSNASPTTAPVPLAPPSPNAQQQTVDLGAFTEFPCFENRTKYTIGGYVRTGGGKVEVVRVAPNSGGCLATSRPDPTRPGMTVGTAFLDKASVTEEDLVGHDVACVMSPKAMRDVGFRVVVMEEDSGLFCQSVFLDKK